MKYSIGYQLINNNDFIKEIIAHKDHITEVYFSWGDFPNGRNNQLKHKDLNPYEAQKKQNEDLLLLSKHGIKFNLLFNGNCYGKDSQSRVFFNKVGDTVDYIINNFGLSSVTTTSLLIAKFIKANFKSIDMRASVNMSIGTIQGMDYVSEYFDSYYMQREYNRDFDKIKTLTEWCKKNGKGLCCLANSGCLNFCSAHTFHDNLVSHETEISAMDNAYEFHGVCKEYLKENKNIVSLINDSNFIRPEDVHLYAQYFDSFKLATRVNKNPIRILKSYVNYKYSGNILEILEPEHSIYPYVIENGNPLKIVKLDANNTMSI